MKSGRAVLRCVAAIAFLGTAVASARAAGLAGTPWASIGVLGGPRLPDAQLARYQWSARPSVAWGAEGRVGRGRLAVGTRLWREADAQTLDLPDGARSLPVHLTSLEAVAQVRLLDVAGTSVSAQGGVGRLRMTWNPDRVEVATGGAPVVVDLLPVTTTIVEAGGAVEHALASRWSAGLELGWRQFPLDTAHRNGSITEYRRESFHDWSARVQFARRLAWR